MLDSLYYGIQWTLYTLGIIHVYLALQTGATDCCSNHAREGCLNPRTGSAPGEKWGYFSVRPHAHTFYWLYYSTHSDNYTNRPTILWLQGGPGMSSAGFGNFAEIGPEDWHLKPRNLSWVEQANLLFVDNPVGAGLSYVTNDTAYTSTTKEIVQDLVSFAKMFFMNNKDLEKSPLYIFGESYGGKMAVAFAQELIKQVKSGAIPCNLTGVAMGDSWIHPMDLTASWGPLLFQTSIVGLEGLKRIQTSTCSVKQAVNQGNWSLAFERWGHLQGVLKSENSQVDFYNIRNFKYIEPHSRQKRDTEERRHPELALPDSFWGIMKLVYKQMNGPVRKKLKIIPSNVTMKFTNLYKVFDCQSGDFMKPVTDIVSDLLANTDLQVIIYQGQWDLICSTPGALRYVERLCWPGKKGYTQAKRRKVATAPITNRPTVYVKSFKNFKFYWVMEAGHSVPAENPLAGYIMLKRILASQD